MTVKVNIDNKTIVRVMIVVVLFFIGIMLLDDLAPALRIIGISAFLAIALNPPVSYISSRITQGRRGFATGIAYVFVISVLGLFLWAIVPPLLKQTTRFLDNVPAYVSAIENEDNAIADFINRYDLDEDIEEYGQRLANNVQDVGGPVINGIGRIGNFLVQLLTVLVLTFFMLVEGPEWIERFWQIQPAAKRDRRKKLVRRMYRVITGYVNGQLFISTLAALTSLIMMLIVGIPYALALAGVVGLFGLIPLVGASLGALVVVAVALFQSVYAGVVMLIFFLVYQQVENSIIQPYVQSRTLEVSPLLIFVAVIIGVNLGGLLAGFIAIPAAAIARILLVDYFKQRGIEVGVRAKKAEGHANS